MRDGLTITAADREALKKVFADFGRVKSDENIFYDLCFCICSPQTTFKSNHQVNDALYKRDFYNKDIPYDELRELVRPVRFLRKADYLIRAKSGFSCIVYNMGLVAWPSTMKREWLVKNVKGLGWKTASHFLRNLGNEDMAIIDTHILKFLQAPQPTGKKQYLMLEKIFQQESKNRGLTPAEFDAFLWKTYSGTPWEQFVF